MQSPLTSRIDGLPQTQLDLSLFRTPMPAPLDRNKVQVPGYEILDILGQGGMGIVYKARQLGLNRIVALKMVLAGRYADADDRARFRLEAEAVAALKHPNIVQVYEIGEHDGSPYFSLEYVEGGTLAQHIAGRPQNPRFAAEMLEQLARAMHAAHEQQIVHRDLKPANVLLVGDRKQETGDRKQETGDRKPSSSVSGSELSPVPCLLSPKVTDFGLAKRLDSDRDLTATGVVAGTPQYMAPEQISGLRGAVGPWVDIYALGVILYEMLTGRPPFLAPNQAETLHRVMHDVPSAPRITQPEIPRDLDTICLKCLEKSPLRRYATAAELADDLTRFLNGEPIVARPVSSAERGFRWCRRNPRLAASLVTLFVTLVLGIAVSTFFAVQADSNAAQYRIQKDAAERNATQFELQRTIAEAQATEALTARGEESRLKQAALEREGVRVRELYDAHMTVAQRAWDEGNITRLESLLTRYSPTSSAAPDPRGFEWYYLRSMHTKRHIEIMEPAGEAKLVGSADGRHAIWFNSWCARLERLDAGSTMLFYKEEDAIVGAAFSPDGKLLATANPKSEVHIRDSRTGDVRHTLKFPGSNVNCLRFSEDGKLLAAGGRNGNGEKSSQCVLWRVDTWEEDFRLPPIGHSVEEVVFTRNSSRLVVLGQWNSVTEWDLTTGEGIERKLPKQIGYLAASPTKDLLAFAEHNGASIRIVHAKTWETLRILTGMYGVTKPLVFAPDGVTLACGASDGSIWLWDATTGEMKARYRGHKESILGLAFEAMRPILYSASMDTHKYGWPLDDSQDFRTIGPRYQFQIQTLLPPLERDLVPCVHSSGCVGMINLRTSRWYRIARSEEYFPVAVATLWKDTREVFVLSQTGRANVVALDSGVTRFVKLPDLAPDVVFGAATPDGSTIVTMHKDGTVQLHRLRQPVAPVTIRLTGGVTRVAVRPDGKQFATADKQGVVRLHDGADGSERGTCEKTYPNATRLAFSPDNRLLAVSGYLQDTVRLWDTTTGQQVRVLDGMPVVNTNLQFTPDGRRLAIWNIRTISFRDLTTGMETLSLQAPDDVRCVQFTADSCGMVSTDGHEMRYWDGRRAFRSDLVGRTWESFRVRDFRIDQPVEPGKPIKVRFSLVNITGHPFRLPPKEWLDAPTIYTYTLQAIQPVEVNGQKGTKVPYSNYAVIPIESDVATDGRLEFTVEIPTKGWPAGAYYLHLIEPTRRQWKPEEAYHRIDFQLK